MTTITHFDQLQLAERWGLSPKTLERWRVIGIGPKFIRLPGKLIYRLCDIDAYENDCLISSTAELRKTTKLPDQPVAAGRR
ncbi:MAG: DNA-binding protein [Rhodoferax sp.]|nr:DNA-binding protein [Rhodoferax sp.]